MWYCEGVGRRGKRGRERHVSTCTSNVVHSLAAVSPLGATAWHATTRAPLGRWLFVQGQDSVRKGV
jgi:hypothetical protein